MKTVIVGQRKFKTTLSEGYCHPLSLQKLPQKEFISKVNKILNGQIKAVPLRDHVVV